MTNNRNNKQTTTKKDEVVDQAAQEAAVKAEAELLATQAAAGKSEESNGSVSAEDFNATLASEMKMAAEAKVTDLKKKADDEQTQVTRGATETIVQMDESALQPVVPVLEEKAPEAPKVDVTPAAMAQQQAEGAMAIYIERIKSDGTAGEQMVVTAMESYLAVMDGPGPLDMNAIVREQTRLYTMFRNIGRREEDFRKAVVAARIFFREYKDTAFHDTRINRGHEALQMNADDRKAFYTYLQLFKIIAAVNDLKEVKKSVDVSRSLTNPAIPAEVKERYVSLVN